MEAESTGLAHHSTSCENSGPAVGEWSCTLAMLPECAAAIAELLLRRKSPAGIILRFPRSSIFRFRIITLRRRKMCSQSGSILKPNSVPTWVIDRTDQQAWYVKFLCANGQSHASEGAGEGLISLSDQSWWNASSARQLNCGSRNRLLKRFMTRSRLGEMIRKLSGKPTSVYQTPKRMDIRAYCLSERRAPGRLLFCGS